jgi:hypothetical protein
MEVVKEKEKFKFKLYQILFNIFIELKYNFFFSIFIGFYKSNPMWGKFKDFKFEDLREYI